MKFYATAASIVSFFLFLSVLANAKITRSSNLRTKSEHNHRNLDGHEDDLNFNRIAFFPVCEQLDPTCNIINETVSEIVYASEDGKAIVYTDASLEAIGFVDISDPSNPKAAGVVGVGGEPTSVVVSGKYAVVGVVTSPDYVNPSGNMKVIDMETLEVVRTTDLGGQPDALALSPDGAYIAVAIENERNEDLNDGTIPQLPAGFLVIVDSSSNDPTDWTTQNVELTDLDGVLYASDPEPEYVSINADNVCVITLQENNGLVLVDLPTALVKKSFTAGTVDLMNIDTVEDGVIMQTGNLSAVPREPDGVTWIGTEYFATADEGDMDGGSRGFTIYNTDGDVVYTSGSFEDIYAASVGHYPEERSENKGNEPENILYAEFGDSKLLFLNSERSSLVFVYEVSDVTNPEFKQVLPAGVGPEGVFALPSRNLLIVASEKDARGDKMRSGLNIYELQDAHPAYPNIISNPREENLPIPFSALSALSFRDGMLYSVEDSFYKKSRMFTIDPSTMPAEVVSETYIVDFNGALFNALSTVDHGGEGGIMGVVNRTINVDNTVNLDLEGIEAVEGGFFLVHEGRGTAGSETRPLESLNMLLHVDMKGVIMDVVLLDDERNEKQVRFGFEGVAVDGDNVVVTVQRAWVGEVNPRIAVYNTKTKIWKYAFYPLDAPASQNGGWVGLSDIASVGNGLFLVLERDNQGGPDAAIKQITAINLGDYSFESGSTVDKKLVHDLMPDLIATAAPILEKIEGLAVDNEGNLWINNDNDGVDDNSGFQMLTNIGKKDIPTPKLPELVIPYYKIQSTQGGCIGVDNILENGVKLLLSECEGDNESLYWHYDLSTGLVHSKADPGYCWTVERGRRVTAEIGRRVRLYKCGEVQMDAKQHFDVYGPQGSTSFHYSMDDRCVLYNGITAEIGDPIIIHNCDGIRKDRQYFTMVIE